MENFKSNKMLWGLVALILIAVIIVGIAIHHTTLPYKLTTQQTLEELTNKDNFVDPTALTLIKQGEKTVFIDLRNPLDYNFKHYNEAINIPAEKILHNDYVEQLEEIVENGNTIILYADIPQRAAGPWMLLKQIGIETVKMYSGTFEQLMADQTLPNSLYNELPIIDTSALTKKKEPEKAPAPKAATPKKAIIPIKSEPEAGGGC